MQCVYSIGKNDILSIIYLWGIRQSHNFLHICLEFKLVSSYLCNLLCSVVSVLCCLIGYLVHVSCMCFVVAWCFLSLCGLHCALYLHYY